MLALLGSDACCDGVLFAASPPAPLYSMLPPDCYPYFPMTPAKDHDVCSSNPKFYKHALHMSTVTTLKQG